MWVGRVPLRYPKTQVLSHSRSVLMGILEMGNYSLYINFPRYISKSQHLPLSCHCEEAVLAVFARPTKQSALPSRLGSTSGEYLRK